MQMQSYLQLLQQLQPGVQPAAAACLPLRQSLLLQQQQLQQRTGCCCKGLGSCY
jgi:hypothetical protein